MDSKMVETVAKALEKIVTYTDKSWNGFSALINIKKIRKEADRALSSILAMRPYLSGKVTAGTPLLAIKSHVQPHADQKVDGVLCHCYSEKMCKNGEQCGCVEAITITKAGFVRIIRRTAPIEKPHEEDGWWVVYGVKIERVK